MEKQFGILYNTNVHFILRGMFLPDISFRAFAIHLGFAAADEVRRGIIPPRDPRLYPMFMDGLDHSSLEHGAT